MAANGSAAVVQKLWNYCHARCWALLRGLHRTAHLPALPQDGPRYARRALLKNAATTAAVVMSIFLVIIVDVIFTAIFYFTGA
jgi:hypothetical protein